MWYILQVAAGSESCMKEKLENLLEKKHVKNLVREVFYLLYEYSYKKSGVRQICTRVLFPGYLFLDMEEKSVRELEEYLENMTEFHYMLSTEKVCTPVSKEEQDFLEQHTSSGHTMRMSQGYMVGREVTITEGAFASYRGELKYVDRHNQYGVMSVQLGKRDVEMRFGLEIVWKEKESI